MRSVESQYGSGAVSDYGHALRINGSNVPLNEEGFLTDISLWTTEVAESMAAHDGVELGEDHWILIKFLNHYYTEYEVVPDMAILSHNLCKDQEECRWTRAYIKELFPDGAKSACRYAGLPAVGRCI